MEALANCLRQELRPRGVDVSVVSAGEFSIGNGWLTEDDLRDQVSEVTDSIFIIANVL